MDHSVFDRVSRALATRPSRRGALASLAGVLAALKQHDATPAAAAAKPKVCQPLNRPCFPGRGLDCCNGATCQEGRCRCRKNARPCRGACLPKAKCCTQRDCPGTQTCQDGRCACPASKRRCGKRCLARDACCRDAECGPGGTCVNGRCRCAAGRTQCQGACIPSDACCRDADCPANGECRGGNCQCAAGFKPCEDACIAENSCCGGCPGDQICSDGTCGPPPCGQGGVCRTFVTSDAYFGDLRVGGTGSGIDGADAKCQALADASPRTQGGIYKAWISGGTDASSPSQRFTNTANTGPYVLVNDAAPVVAEDWAELTSGTLRTAIIASELGLSPGAVTTWTSTLSNGLPGSPHGGRPTCQDWTSSANGSIGSFGGIMQTSSVWTSFSDARCDTEFALYCFEQG